MTDTVSKNPNLFHACGAHLLQTALYYIKNQVYKTSLPILYEALKIFQQESTIRSQLKMKLFKKNKNKERD